MDKTNNQNDKYDEIYRQEDKIEVLLLYLLRNKIKIYFITSIFLLMGIIYAFIATPWYSTTVKIMPSNSAEQNILSQYSSLAAMAGLNFNNISGSNYALYPEIIKSDFILNRILKHKFETKTGEEKTLFEFWNVDIDSSEEDWKHKLFEEAKEELRGNYISVSTDKINDLMTIQIKVPEDPVLAANLGNFIITQLEIYNKHYRQNKASDQRQFIENSIDKTFENLKNIENEMQIFLEKNKDLTSPVNNLKYERLKTELDLQRTVFIELKKQLELAKIQEIKETETLNILEYATIPIEKFKPKRIIIIISMLILGFILSILFVFLNDFLKKLLTFFYKH